MLQPVSACLRPHRLNAHIAAHGRAPRRSGATPAATSQLQLKARPTTSATTATASQNVRLRSTDPPIANSHPRAALAPDEVAPVEIASLAIADRSILAVAFVAVFLSSHHRVEDFGPP